MGTRLRTARRNRSRTSRRGMNRKKLSRKRLSRKKLSRKRLSRKRKVRGRRTFRRNRRQRGGAPNTEDPDTRAEKFANATRLLKTSNRSPAENARLRELLTEVTIMPKYLGKENKDWFPLPKNERPDNRTFAERHPKAARAALGFLPWNWGT